MHWLVFAEDWGRHPSTTQHLIANLPDTDHITWVGSLGLRPPRLTPNDLRRVLERLRTPTSHAPRKPHTPTGEGQGRAPDHLIAPRLLPWHLPALALNRRLFARTLRRGPTHSDPPIVALLANPVAALYADLASPTATIYLRLDDWPHYRGVDPTLIARTEPRLLREADLVLAPNPRLLAGVTARSAVLPQGVDLERFASVPLTPPSTPTKVLGYWGTLASWLDQDLVLAVARRHSDWTLELIGRVDTDLSRLTSAKLPNLRLLPPVPHEQLAGHTTHWRAAWAPFIRGDHIESSSSLKLREYLAAGFPTAATPHPEAASLPHIELVPDLVAMDAFLDRARDDMASARAARRASVADQSWESRAAELRAHAAELMTRGRR